MRVASAIGCAFAALSLGCSSSAEVERRTAAEHGRDLFVSTETSSSSLNRFTCASCHSAELDPTRILPGAPLAGATSRPTFWGGQYTSLLRAINDCRYYFMGASSAWTASEDQASSMFAYLASLPPSLPAAQPFTVVRVAEDLPPGDAGRGRRAYEASCQSCHGEARSGAGALREEIVSLPEQAVDDLRGRYGFGDRELRLVFIEKVRHGPFLGLSGTMPPYSREALSDADLSAILAYLGL